MQRWYSVGKLKYAEGSVIIKEIFKGKVDATLFCMAKGTEVSEHISAREGIIFVLEGKGTFILDGKKMPAHPGVVIRLDKRSVHSIKADENTSFILQLAG